MTSQNAAGSAVIPYAPQAKNTDRQGDQLDRVGHGQSPSKAVGDPSPGGFAICGCDRRISGTAAALSAIRHGGLRSISRAAVNIDRTLDPNQMPAKGELMKIALSIMALATFRGQAAKRGTADWFVS